MEEKALKYYNREKPIDTKFIRKFRNTMPKKTINSPDEVAMELLNQILIINPDSMSLSLKNSASTNKEEEKSKEVKSKKKNKKKSKYNQSDSDEEEMAYTKGAPTNKGEVRMDHIQDTLCYLFFGSDHMVREVLVKNMEKFKQATPLVLPSGQMLAWPYLQSYRTFKTSNT